jgi:hypothetical protein
VYTRHTRLTNKVIDTVLLLLLWIMVKLQDNYTHAGSSRSNCMALALLLVTIFSISAPSYSLFLACPQNTKGRSTKGTVASPS